MAAYSLTALPLGVYALGHWDIVNGRAAQVSVFSPAINHGKLFGTLLNQGVAVAKMFLIQGDANTRHSDWLTSRQAYYSFDTFSTDLVLAVNQFTGMGWQGSTPTSQSQPGPHGEVWIDPQLYHFTKTVEFLIPQDPSLANASVHLLGAGASRLPAGRNVRLIVVPGEEANQVAILPPNSLITIRDGSLAKADVEVKPFLLFRAVTAQPAANLGGSAACLGAGIELLPPSVTIEPNAVVVDLLWRAKAGGLPALTVFVHLYQDGVLVGQSDSFPAAALYSFAWLRAGDVIRDTRTVAMDPGAFSPQTGKVGMGLYDAASGQRQAATDCADQSLGDEVFIR